MAMESIHSETYSLQIENIIKDPEEKDILFNAIVIFLVTKLCPRRGLS